MALRLQYHRFHQREIFEQIVNVSLFRQSEGEALGSEPYPGIAIRETPGEVGAISIILRSAAAGRADPSVEEDLDYSLLVARELPHLQFARVRGAFPIDVARVVLRLIRADAIKIVPIAAQMRFEFPDERIEKNFRARAWFERGIHDGFAAQRNPGALAQEAEREFRRDGEEVFFMPSTVREHHGDRRFDGRAPGNDGEIDGIGQDRRGVVSGIALAASSMENDGVNRFRLRIRCAPRWAFAPRHFPAAGAPVRGPKEPGD